ncbi:hypothetical protein GCM10025867_43230 [Frondihabitans sucicola]|uniref:Peptidase S33 tripeptidyl aminopeptidase-like C-terminal domain-containing protein n=1 Tax=Frondihabitans sucicola TaxID=1268041 RepID=A0ABN6Y7F8_9MICO|nr:alpha/beta hydrolase [Frondihabitans sucicola]BDZ52082.1 hypothetical protein GCM10025867_43230 [Frondihabitans sucicola]
MLLGGGAPDGDLDHLTDHLLLSGFSVALVADVAVDPVAARSTALRIVQDTTTERPHVLIGSGVGATLAADIAATRPVGLAALVLANVVTPASRGVTIPRGIALPKARDVLQPVLFFHGDTDPITDIADAANWATQLPFGAVRIVQRGGHGVLGGEERRSVAASIVLFLERQRAGAPVLSDGFA